jgi:hypothetical protein
MAPPAPAMEKPEQRSAAEDSADEELSAPNSAEEAQPPARRKKTKNPDAKKKKKKSQGGTSQALDQLPVGGLDGVTDTAQNAVGGVTGALGGVANGALQQQGGGDGGKSDTLRLRLDLNLDIEIQLKARIHGDLELALLYVFILHSSLPLCPIFTTLFFPPPITCSLHQSRPIVHNQNATSHTVSYITLCSALDRL